MRIRIHFRGLVLFRFPKAPDKHAGKIVAELISDPQRKEPRRHPHEHRAQIQEITSRGVRNLLPQDLTDGATVNIAVAGDPEVSRSDSFNAYVPKLSAVLKQWTDPGSTITKGARRPEYVRNTIVVNRGQIRVKDVVIWDAGGFSLPGGRSDGRLPSVPTQLKFMGCNLVGHMANECVIDIPEADNLTITTDGNTPELKDKDKEYLKKDHTPDVGSPDYDAVEILITNYEPQRRKPTPWGMDFQWLFAAAGYGRANLENLPDGEFKTFSAFARTYDGALFAEDVREIMRSEPLGTPFPYVMDNGLFSVPLPAIHGKPGSAQNDIDSRPVCVPGDDD